MNKKGTDLRITEKLHLTDRYDSGSFSHSDEAATLKVSQSPS
jgi:hypothetical protein